MAANKIGAKRRKKHIETAGSAGCPYCGAAVKNIDYSNLEPVEDGDVEQECECRNCGNRWKDVFRLVEVRELARRE